MVYSDQGKKEKVRKRSQKVGEKSGFEVVFSYKASFSYQSSVLVKTRVEIADNVQNEKNI